jgi:hypothetical protein
LGRTPPQEDAASIPHAKLEIRNRKSVVVVATEKNGLTFSENFYIFLMENGYI